MHLSLLKQAVDTKPEALGESGSVFANGDLIVTQVEAQVEAVVGCDAHSTQARRKRVAESVLMQKYRMQGAHGRIFSTPESGQPTSMISNRPRSSNTERVDRLGLMDAEDPPFYVDKWSSRYGISASEACHLGASVGAAGWG